jgi:hypothetical protein
LLKPLVIVTCEVNGVSDVRGSPSEPQRHNQDQVHHHDPGTFFYVGTTQVFFGELDAFSRPVRVRSNVSSNVSSGSATHEPAELCRQSVFRGLSQVGRSVTHGLSPVGRSVPSRSVCLPVSQSVTRRSVVPPVGLSPTRPSVARGWLLVGVLVFQLYFVRGI